MKSPKEIMTARFDAYNRRDANALIELYADDAEAVQGAFDEPLRGRAALLASFIEFFKAFSDNYADPENIFVDGDQTIIERRGGTFTGNLDNDAPTGKSFVLRGCGFFQIIDGKINLQRGYFNKNTWFSQIGLSAS